MNHYQILGVGKQAGYGEIKRNYRSLVKQYHPDLNPSAEAAALIVKITEAYEILSDPLKKEIYDQALNAKVHQAARQEPEVDERELRKRAYARKKRAEEERHWHQLFMLKVKFYKMQRFFAVIFMIISLVYTYDYHFTEIRSTCQVTKIFVTHHKETALYCSGSKFQIEADFMEDFLKNMSPPVNIHYSILHDSPVRVSFSGSREYIILDSLHLFRNFFPLLLFLISALLLIYHEYQDWLLTIGLLPFFITLFLIISSSMSLT